MAAFVALLKRFNIEHKVVTEQWPKVGTMELTSHVAALKAAKPDLIFSSLLFADLPVFMKQAHAAELTKGTKLVFPAAGWQHTLMKKDFTPEGMLFGHNTLYFDNPNASPMAKEFVAWYAEDLQGLSEWEADRAYFAIASYKAAVEKAAKAKGGSWPSQDDVIDAMVGLSVESLGGKGSWRKDHIADQTFVQGFTTHNNKYDFVTLDRPASRPCTRPTCRSRRAPISGTGSRPRSSRSDGPIAPHVRPMSAFANILLGGIFHAAVLFLVAAGLQLVFGVQKIVNLACGSFYALGAYFGITFVSLALKAGMPPWTAAAAAADRRPADGCRRPADRAAAAHRLRSRRELPAAADLRAGADVPGRVPLRLGRQSALARQRAIWSTARSAAGDFIVPVYNLLVIAAAIAAARRIGLFLQRTNYGRLLRATAENRAMAEALGVNVRRVYAVVFTLGTLLGTIGGALVVPTAAASLDMAIEFVIEAFAVVVIGGLGSMRGALVGALIVGLIRADSLVLYPEFEMLAIYLIVIACCCCKPSGLFGKAGGMRRAPRRSLVVAGIVGAGAGAGPGAALLRQPAGAVLRLRHRAARLQSAVRLHRPAVLRARHVSRLRRLWRGRDRRRARHQVSSRSC